MKQKMNLIIVKNDRRQKGAQLKAPSKVRKVTKLDKSTGGANREKEAAKREKPACATKKEKEMRK